MNQQTNQTTLYLEEAISNEGPLLRQLILRIMQYG